MVLTLQRHPDFPCESVAAIAVAVARPRAGRLELAFSVRGATSALVLPPPAAAVRTDGLWRHTCFEAFLGAGEGYYEFNLSPSGAWAAYRFDGYRQGMAAADVASPASGVARRADGFDLTAAIDLPPDAAGPLGLSAVIEEAGGRLSYWALAHPPGRPDFHHADCFAAELPAPERP